MKKLLTVFGFIILVSTTNTFAGTIYLYDGNSCTNNLEGTVTDGFNIYNFKKISWLANDEVRSLKLNNVRSGAIIRVEDDSAGDQSDDYAIITAKKYLPGNWCIGTFQTNLETADIKIEYYYGGNLDGKVSFMAVY